ncbi:MAG: Stp1/IreP family PP2C-type Ser/Thr phosphatase [Actinobacteria bacterium]|nr:Stp1/IreP family PP2C-type Ser/Thr phosphatase [Actinomycetota bacterium]
MRLGGFAGGTDPGRRRRRNEDSYVIDPPLFAVADGIGGAQAGEVASKLAAGAVKEHGADVESLVQEANRRVHQRSLEDPNMSGMGTTLTVAAVADGTISIGHVGDSRAYLVRDGNLEQLTEDHSLVGELMRTGKLSAEEAGSHPQRSMITRALGTDPNVDVDIFSVEPRVGDLFLLCSDGLTSMVDDREILRLIGEKRGDLKDLVKALIKAANKGGGEDNITVVAFEIGEASEAVSELEDTAVAPAPSAEPEPDEEDTLTEADRVPTVDTAVVSVGEIAAAYEREQEQAPAPRRGRRFLMRALSFLIVIALLFGVAYVILWGLAA